MVLPVGSCRRTGVHHRCRHKLSELSEILGSGGEEKLVSCAGRAAEPKTTHPEDALQVGEEHLNPLALAPRLLEGRRAGERTGKVAGAFVHAPGNLPSRCVGAASSFESARAAIQ